MAEQVEYIFRKNAVNNYLQEITYLKKHGYFHIKEVDANGMVKRDPRASALNTMTIGILGPNKTIFLIKNISPTTRLEELASILQQIFPDIFQDKTLFKSFYIPHLPGENKKVKELDCTLAELELSNDDIIGIADQKKDSANFSRFFHQVCKQPDAFINKSDEKIDTLRYP